MNKRMSKRILKWGVAIVISCLVLLWGVGEYFLHYALSRSASEYNIENEFAKLKKDYPWTAEWVDSIRTCDGLRDTFIVNSDGVRMHGWYMPAHEYSEKTAVIVHGYKSNPVDMMSIGYMYHHDLGWNILLPDLVAHGQSEGEVIQMGWKDRKDVGQWIEVAHKIFQSDTMVVHGISMGAATTMCVAGDETPDYVRAFIADCGYTSVWDEFSGEMKVQFGLPAFPILNATSMLCKMKYGWSFTEASPLMQIEKCEKPVLFIHGDNDTYVPTRMVYSLIESARCPKDYWIAPGSKHADSYKDHHEEYTDRVNAFINKY